MNDRPEENHQDRLVLAITGAVSGLALYLLVDLLPDMVDNTRLLLLLISGGVGFFSVLLALLGPAPLRSAVPAAVALSVPAALLFTWASLRFAEVDDFLDGGHAIVALSVLLGVATPFAAARLEHQSGWKDYARLFDYAWNIVVRYAAAGLFVGVVWGVLYLSDTLLGLVGVTIIEDIIDLDPSPWLISGLALGLGLAVVHELRDYVSPFLIIQLLRILMPLLLLVLAVFILALPVQGLSGLFGGLSPAATLAATAYAGVTLISAAIHRGEEAEVEGRILRLAAQALGVLIAVPAVLAVYSVWVRIAQYGLTPDRIAALVVALVVMAYGLAYATAVVMRGDWAARMRRANLVLAGIVMAVSLLWLTPALNPERMSVSSQLARAEAGTRASELPIWELTHEWGKAGLEGAARLRAMTDHPQHDDILALLDKAKASDNRYQFEDDAEATDIGTLEGRVPLRPEGVTLPQGALDAMRARDRTFISEACDRVLPDGGPGCVIVMGEFDSRRDAPQGLGFFLQDGGWVRVMSLELQGDKLVERGSVQGLRAQVDQQAIADLQAGRFELAPITLNMLKLGDLELYPEN